MVLEDRTSEEISKQDAIRALALKQQQEAKRLKQKVDEKSFKGQLKNSLRKTLEGI